MPHLFSPVLADSYYVGADLEKRPSSKREVAQRIVQIDSSIKAINLALAQIESDLAAGAQIVAIPLSPLAKN